MFRHVLIPADLTDKPGRAVDAVIGLLGPGSTRVSLLHVIETIQDVEFEEIEDFYRQLRTRAETAVEHWAKPLVEKGFRVEREIVFGSRGVEILRFADTQSCDLIVLASHTVEPGHEALGLATLSHQVAVLTRSSVLLVR